MECGHAEDDSRHEAEDAEDYLNEGVRGLLHRRARVVAVGSGPRRLGRCVDVDPLRHATGNRRFVDETYVKTDPPFGGGGERAGED